MRTDAGFILIVEDDRSTAGLMAVLLRMEGYAVEIAYSCKDAMAVCEKATPALVILDYLIDGEGCDKLVSNGTVGGAPAIMVSAHDKAKDAYERLRLLAFMPKPFHVESLTDLVKAIEP